MRGVVGFPKCPDLESDHGGDDGLDLVRYLRKLKKWKDLPVIALTAHAFSSDQRGSMEAGCNDFLSKPVGWDTVLDRIETYI